MISKGVFSLALSLSLSLLRKSSCFLLVCHWLNCRPYSHLSLSLASLSVILAAVHVQNFAMPNRRKLSSPITWGFLMREWRHSGMHCCLCLQSPMSMALNYTKERITFNKAWWSETQTAPTSVAKTVYSERSLRTARYHIHHFIHQLSQKFWENRRVDITSQEYQILVKLLT